MCDSKEYNIKPEMIYISGPYTADTLTERIANVEKAMAVGIILYKKGHCPFIPHLTHYLDLEATKRGTPVLWSEYMTTDLAWLHAADAVFFIGRSRGADMEYTEAIRHHIKIYYDIATVPVVLHGDRNLIP